MFTSFVNYIAADECRTYLFVAVCILAGCIGGPA